MFKLKNRKTAGTEKRRKPSLQRDSIAAPSPLPPHGPHTPPPPTVGRGPAGNLSTIPEHGAQMKVHCWLHAVPGHLQRPTVEANRMAFPRQGVKVLFAETLLTPPLPAVRHPQPRKCPDTQGWVFSMQTGSQVGGGSAPRFLEKAVG